jgi:hypothetical protein
VSFAHELVTNESHINLSRHCQILSFSLGDFVVTGLHRFRRDLDAPRIPSEKPGTAWVRGESWIRVQKRRCRKLPTLLKRDIIAAKLVVLNDATV